MGKSKAEYARESYYRRKHPCIDCGKLVAPVSKRCGSCHFVFLHASGMIPHCSGERHPNWKGGKAKTASGYITVICHGHPRASTQHRVLEHILVWEQAHNKPVPNGWEVHHYNGIKDDNRPSNLFAKSKKQHSLIIPELQKRIQELEALLNNQHQLL